MTVILLLFRELGVTAFFGTVTSHGQAKVARNSSATTQFGPRHQLNYQQWLSILTKEAQVAAEKRPEKLNILLGDSLSLWFPPELLPTDINWLNQGISGETTPGLLKRLDLFDKTQPKTIWLMIGINDLIRGENDQTILENQRQIIQYLKKVHPEAQIVIQSILPHGDDQATWEGRAKLLAIPNDRIRLLNQQLKAIASLDGVKFLNLHPLFTDSQGNLRYELSTDGLHLNPQGYLVWRSALQVYAQMELEAKQ
jgi:lysophospholipase L1-like esterase